jgi:D-hydantoinase
MTDADLVVSNARVVTETGVINGGLAVDGGRIQAMFEGASPYSSKEKEDAGGGYVLPGVIDPHLHLQDAHYKYEQLIQSESRAAAAGGVTTIIPMIFRRSDPEESFLTVMPDVLSAAEGASPVDYAFSTILFAEKQIGEIAQYATEFGVTTHKVMMAYKGPEAEVFGVRSVDDGQILATLREVGKLGHPGMVMIHTENMEIVYRHKAELMASGRQDIGAYDDARPYFAEEENLRRAIFFAEISGAPLYVVHMSIGTGVPLVLDARLRGVPVIAETCPHFLQFNRDTAPHGWMGKVNPPIRSSWHQDRLWAGIREGVIGTVGSDHSTLMPREEKMKSDLWSALPGFPGTGEILGVLMSSGFLSGRIDILDVARVASTNPAKAFGLYPQKGTLRVGSDADFVIVDEGLEHVVSAENHHSIAGYNLYEGCRFTGWPSATFVRGQAVMRDNKVIGKPGWGRYLRRELGGPQDAYGLLPAPRRESPEGPR